MKSLLQTADMQNIQVVAFNFLAQVFKMWPICKTVSYPTKVF